MQYVLTLSKHASVKAFPFVSLLMHSLSPLNQSAYKIIHGAKSSPSHPTYNPSILLAAIWSYCFEEAEARALAMNAVVL